MNNTLTVCWLFVFSFMERKIDARYLCVCCRKNKTQEAPWMADLLLLLYSSCVDCTWTWWWRRTLPSTKWITYASRCLCACAWISFGLLNSKWMLLCTPCKACDQRTFTKQQQDVLMFVADGAWSHSTTMWIWRMGENVKSSIRRWKKKLMLEVFPFIVAVCRRGKFSNYRHAMHHTIFCIDGVCNRHFACSRQIFGEFMVLQVTNEQYRDGERERDAPSRALTIFIANENIWKINMIRCIQQHKYSKTTDKTLFRCAQNFAMLERTLCNNIESTWTILFDDSVGLWISFFTRSNFCQTQSKTETWCVSKCIQYFVHCSWLSAVECKREMWISKEFLMKYFVFFCFVSFFVNASQKIKKKREEKNKLLVDRCWSIMYIF